MRGKAGMIKYSDVIHRITPAYAGKRQNFDFFFFQCEDHPRLCGEKKGTKERRYKEAGSPPPMRGKGIFFRSISALSRITPAYAGKRSHSGKNRKAV